MTFIDNLNYEDFLSKYNKIIKINPNEKPDLVVINQALLPLTDIWNNSALSIMLKGEESVLIERFINREKLDSNKRNYHDDIMRHMKLYNILNSKAEVNIVYDTTNNFMDARQFQKYLEEKRY